MANPSLADVPFCEQGLGKAQRKALDFIRSCNGWHTYANDVRRVVLALATRGLVEVSESTKQFRAVCPLHCDQCEMLSINGVACHETGCPNAKKTWVPARGEWVLFVDCFDCGFPVEVGTTCSCQEPIADDSEETEAQ